MESHTLINDYLTAFGVPHTDEYGATNYEAMPFKTLFGLSKLLEKYGVTSEGYDLTDKSELTSLTPPFLASTPGGIVIVTDVADGEVSYLSRGVWEKAPVDEFTSAWDGRVLLSYPSAGACEPDYTKHRRIDLAMRSKGFVLACSVVLIVIYLFVSNGLWRHASTILLTLINGGGIYLTYLLVQKSLNIKSKAADRVCSVIQAGGCDSILATSASKFFGIFGWSEVGFSYFTVSLMTMLLFPSMLPWLALCNVCCLPFTVWSIWYQRFRAKHWCTLCVCVQGSLWLLFFCYLCGGWLKEAWPPALSLIALGLSYLAVMLGLNAIMPLIQKNQNNETNA